ncbi:MAG: hypothetical protein AUK47_04740 [Deltaproteobacteria bacterium CG2_30_63_29]|nr:MAG: hypothetical protein AUK47_04740 [Deltaproteobacteria bacterium CG2_30_63_29]
MSVEGHRPFHVYWGGALLVVLLLSCTTQRETARGPAGPSTPEEQVAAVKEAVEKAIVAETWPRAEAGLDALRLIEPDVDAHQTRLRWVKRRRAVAEVFQEVEGLLESGAWLAARTRLETLKDRELDPEDEVERERLLLRVEEVKAPEW